MDYYLQALQHIRTTHTRRALLDGLRDIHRAAVDARQPYSREQWRHIDALTDARLFDIDRGRV